MAQVSAQVKEMAAVPVQISEFAENMALCHLLVKQLLLFQFCDFQDNLLFKELIRYEFTFLNLLAVNE